MRRLSLRVVVCVHIYGDSFVCWILRGKTHETKKVEVHKIYSGLLSMYTRQMVMSYHGYLTGVCGKV